MGTVKCPHKHNDFGYCLLVLFQFNLAILLFLLEALTNMKHEHTL